MRTYRPWLVGATLLASLAAAGYVFITRIPDLAELGELSDSLDAREAEARRQQEIETRRQAHSMRNQARQLVLRQVVRRRLTLLEAAARFRDLDRGPEVQTALRLLRYYFPGDTDQ